jgi:isopenicillin-N N-acyltransferase-like protein
MALAGQAAIVGQTWDWKPATRETVIVLACAPHDRPGFVTVVEAGLWAKSGMNEEGVAVTTNALQSSKDHGEAGVPYHAVLREAITSATLQEAEDAIARGPRASSANYLLGDRHGRIADLEALPGGPDEVHRDAGGTLSHANIFLWPTPRRFKDVGRIDGEDSVVRRDRAEATLASGTASVADLEATFASHDDPAGPVCVHEDPSEEPPARYATVFGLVAETGTGTLHLAPGNPCEHPFETYSVADLVGRARAND